MYQLRYKPLFTLSFYRNGTYRGDTAPDPTYDHISPSQPVDADNGAYATFDDAKLKLKKVWNLSFTTVL